MTKFFKTLNLPWASLALFSCVFLANLLTGPVLSPDSSSYIAMSAIRSPLYPLFLQAHFFFFGPVFGLENFYPILVSQTLLTLFAVYFISKTLEEIFHVSKRALFLLHLIFLVSSIPFVCGYSTQFLMSEALAYPLFLITVACILKGVFSKNTNALLHSFFYALLLILTRSQFIFLYVVLAIVLLYIGVFQRKSFRMGVLTVGFLSSIFAHTFLEKSYHYFTHGQFEQIPFIGIQMIVQPIFLSTQSDESKLSTPQERAIFNTTQEEMKAQGLTLEQMKKNSFPHDLPDAVHFMAAYNPICHGIISPAVGQHGVKDAFEADTILKKMSMSLIKANPLGYLKLYGQNIFYSTIRIYSFLFILGVFSFLCFFMHTQYRDKLSFFGLLVMITTLGNLTLIAFFEPLLVRYTFYTDFLLAALFIIVIDKALLAYKGERL